MNDASHDVLRLLEELSTAWQGAASVSGNGGAPARPAHG
jgi:hypothetical protein